MFFFFALIGIFYILSDNVRIPVTTNRLIFIGRKKEKKRCSPALNEEMRRIEKGEDSYDEEVEGL